MFSQKQALISLLTLAKFLVGSLCRLSWVEQPPERSTLHIKTLLPNLCVSFLVLDSFPIASGEEVSDPLGCWLEAATIANATYKARGCLSGERSAFLILIVPNCHITLVLVMRRLW